MRKDARMSSPIVCGRTEILTPSPRATTPDKVAFSYRSPSSTPDADVQAERDTLVLEVRREPVRVRIDERRGGHLLRPARGAGLEARDDGAPLRRAGSFGEHEA